MLVGVVRPPVAHWDKCEVGCPNARGGGPLSEIQSLRLNRLSPCSWGWSAIPTKRRLAQERCPHARGGGPNKG